MKNLAMLALVAVMALWGAVSVAQAYVVSGGLECYLDFTVDPGGTAVIDKTGNGNNATLISGPDPDGGGPATGVPTWDGTGVRFFGGWVDIDPTGSLNALTAGTLEIIYDDMPIIDTQISTGTPISVANPGNAAGDGRTEDWEIWIDHRALGGRGAYISGRVGGADQFGTSYVHGMYIPDSMQREQYFAQWSGGQVRLVGRYYLNGVVTTNASPWVSTGSMPAFLSAATNVRFGGRQYEEPYASSNPMEPPYYRTVGNIFRVYDRVLTDAEMLQNWNEYNAEIPEPATMSLLLLGGLLGLRRKK